MNKSVKNYVRGYRGWFKVTAELSYFYFKKPMYLVFALLPYTCVADFCGVIFHTQFHHGLTCLLFLFDFQILFKDLMKHYTGDVQHLDHGAGARWIKRNIYRMAATRNSTTRRRA